MKNILISGGSSGIGLALSEILYKEGAQVISLSRTSQKVQRALKERPHLSGKIDFIHGDISDPADMKKVCQYISEKYGVLHGLVNNAAILTKGTIETINIEDWQRTINVNLSGAYIITQTLLPLLKKASGAAIVNVSSIAGLKPGTSVAYSVSKAGLDMLTRFLAGDLGPYKIRVNSVNPGLVKTHIHMDNNIVPDKTTYQNMLDKSIPRYPIGRIGEPNDVAEAIAFLLSDKASWISGSILSVDGGVMVENDLIPPKNTNH